MMRNPTISWVTVALLCGGCLGTNDDGDDAFGGGIPGVGESGSTSGGDGDGANDGDGADGGGEAGGGADDGGGSPVKLDVTEIPEAPDADCVPPDQVSCDELDDDPFHALALNCPGGTQVTGSTMGDPAAIHVHRGALGTFKPEPHPPMEGETFVILSTGVAVDLLQAGFFMSLDHPGQDPGANLPSPLDTAKVDALGNITCAQDVMLVGTGDCSNTLQDQWDQGFGDGNDYAEVRLTMQVPEATTGFSYNFAFFSTEYPVWYQTEFNDMYIAWLDSESWTGNISFDEMGNPISLNAGFLDFKDASNPFDCPAPCTAEELEGTAMEGHAGTKWLTTTAAVVPNETITLVFAIFDLSDGFWDSSVILDNFQWGCGEGPPLTIPG